MSHVKPLHKLCKACNSQQPVRRKNCSDCGTPLKPAHGRPVGTTVATAWDIKLVVVVAKVALLLQGTMQVMVVQRAPL